LRPAWPQPNGWPPGSAPDATDEDRFVLLVLRPRQDQHFDPAAEDNGGPYITQCRRLAPRYDMLKLPWAEYVPAYDSRILAKLDARAVWDVLHQRAGQSVEPVICCYEKSNEHCHRRLVAEWFKRELGEDVTELAATGPTTQSVLLGTMREWAIAVLAAKAKAP
jgi:hypothetical protein